MSMIGCHVDNQGFRQKKGGGLKNTKKYNFEKISKTDKLPKSGRI
jgi:hypothetical protein